MQVSTSGRGAAYRAGGRLHGHGERSGRHTAGTVRARAVTVAHAGTSSGTGGQTPLPQQDGEQPPADGAAARVRVSHGGAAAVALRHSIDDELSNRSSDLDPAGYFLIRVDDERG